MNDVAIPSPLARFLKTRPSLADPASSTTSVLWPVITVHSPQIREASVSKSGLHWIAERAGFGRLSTRFIRRIVLYSRRRSRPILFLLSLSRARVHMRGDVLCLPARAALVFGAGPFLFEVHCSSSRVSAAILDRKKAETIISVPHGRIARLPRKMVSFCLERSQ